MKNINISLTDIVEAASQYPQGTVLTSEVSCYVGENGELIKEYKILAP